MLELWVGRGGLVGGGVVGTSIPDESSPSLSSTRMRQRNFDGRSLIIVLRRGPIDRNNEVSYGFFYALKLGSEVVIREHKSIFVSRHLQCSP